VPIKLLIQNHYLNHVPFTVALFSGPLSKHLSEKAKAHSIQSRDDGPIGPTPARPPGPHAATRPHLKIVPKLLPSYANASLVHSTEPRATASVPIPPNPIGMSRCQGFRRTSALPAMPPWLEEGGPRTTGRRHLRLPVPPLRRSSPARLLSSTIQTLTKGRDRWGKEGGGGASPRRDAAWWRHSNSTAETTRYASPRGFGAAGGPTTTTRDASAALP
jgi:hypothetical protein